jgi:hypothetical protein
MKMLALAGCAAAAMLMSGCASGGYYGGGFAAADDVWYDGYYGPYGGGYWDGDIFFYRGRDGHFVQDDARHFRHDQFASARSFHASRRGAPTGTGTAASAREHSWRHH